MKRFIASLLAAAALFALPLCGCGQTAQTQAAQTQAEQTQTAQTQTEQTQTEQTQTEQTQTVQTQSGAQDAKDAQDADKAQGRDGSASPAKDSAPAGAGAAAAKTAESAGAGSKTASGESCFLTITCANLVGNEDRLPAEKRGLVPADGMLLKKTEMEIASGDSVFDVLKRAAKDNKIQMEFSTSPVYNTAYIEGIGNLYEFDAGSSSGWCYTVNGGTPDVGCSKYALSDGDDVVFAYTLNLGGDVS